MPRIMELESSIFSPVDTYSIGFIQLLCGRCAPYSFIAYLGNDAVGYVISCLEGAIGHVVSIGVLGEFRGMGIGKALMCSSLCSMLRGGARGVYLEVRISNDAAKSLYSRLGFRVRDTLKGYYRDGEDAYLMVLEDLAYSLNACGCGKSLASNGTA